MSIYTTILVVRSLDNLIIFLVIYLCLFTLGVFKPVFCRWSGQTC